MTKHQILEDNKNEIIDLYSNQIWSTRKIGFKFGFSKTAILSFLKHYNIEIRASSGSLDGINVDLATEMYQSHILEEVAKFFNTTKKSLAKLFRANNVHVHGNRTRDYTLVCQDCNKNFITKAPTAIRCEECRHLEKNRESKERSRLKSKIYYNLDQHKCLKCGIDLSELRINRKYCDECRQIQLNELRRKRRAENPEKYRKKDLEYLHKDISHGQATTANHRAKLHKKSGKIDTATIKEIFKLDNYICQYCNQRGGELTNDHIIPLSQGGENIKDNLVTACRTCNISKGKKSLLEFLLYRSEKAKTL